jgi:LysR family hydrogen peroxide-inducible transcriptional activator
MESPPFPPHAFTIRQLQYAVAVGDALSFRRAAQHCGVSQPALSGQLAALEEGLGAQLFERSRRQVLPTPAGLVLLERMRRVLAEADDLSQAARRAADPFQGVLRVGVIPTISPYLLPTVSAPLRERWPHLTLAWVEEKTSVLVARLARGEMDAAVLALEADLGDAESTPIARDDFLLAAPPEHALAHGRAPLDPEALRGETVLLLDDGHCFREQSLAVCHEHAAKESPFRATSLPTLVQMVAGGAGLTLLPAMAAPTELSRSRLIVRTFRAPSPGRTIGLIWRKGSSLGPALRQMAEAMRGAWPGGRTLTP